MNTSCCLFIVVNCFLEHYVVLCAPTLLSAAGFRFMSASEIDAGAKEIARSNLLLDEKAFDGFLLRRTRSFYSFSIEERNGLGYRLSKIPIATT